MTPQKLALESFTAGDEWSGIPSLTIRHTPEGGVAAPPDSPLARVTMRFAKQGSEREAVVELSSDVAGEITLTSAANWELTIPAQIIAGLTAGKWEWRMRFWDSSTDGSPKTYLADTLTVLETI